MITKYVTYRRVSTKEQGRSGHGLDGQIRDIELFLEKHHDAHTPCDKICVTAHY
jgi:DNA invertase Pin-like site-specific DNA recombinase